MKKLVLSCVVLIALSLTAACLDITPYPIIETDAGIPDTPGDAGVDE